jgi:flagellar assembly factor FliW
MTPATMLQENTREDVEIESQLLGTLSVPAAQIYSFEQGVYGFEASTDFALLPAERDGFFWLQSLQFDALTFLLVDPFRFVEGYSVELGADELGDLLPDDASEMLVLAILTLPKTPDGTSTVNLQGPIALNLVEQLGAQVVVESEFGIHHPVELSRTEGGS